MDGDNLSVPDNKASTSKSKMKPTTTNGNNNSGALSQPSSPRISRLSKVTKLISRSDANLMHTKKSVRMDSTDSGTPEDGGSPSKGVSLVSKATVYMSHLKNKIGKHRAKSKERERIEGLHQGNPPLVNQFPSCCHRQVSSSDYIVGSTESGASRNSTVPSRAESEEQKSSGCPGESAAGSASISIDNVNLSSSNSEFEPSDTTTLIENSEKGLSGNMNKIMMNSTNPSYPFYTMSFHLQRGKNLVAKDPCGSSDPYVKVKIGDKLHFKSKTIYRDLNPVWDEFFVLPIQDLNQPVIFKVFDYDFGFQDDFMGMSTIDCKQLVPNKSQEITLVLTESNTAGEVSMGEVFLAATLVPRTIEEKEIWFSGDGSGRLVDTQKRLKSQIWSSVLTVLLIEAKDITADGSDDHLIMDAYIKFRLGNQKYKSRTITRSDKPKWLEQFDFYVYEGQPQILELQLFDESFSREHIGRAYLDIGTLEKEVTHNQILEFQDGQGKVTLLLTISGTSGSDTISDLSYYNPTDHELKELNDRYALKRSLHCLKDVGHLTVKIFEAQGLAALDIGGKSDPFCVLEICNARLQTQTEYRTLSPIWNKIFTFAIKDVSHSLDITVFDEDKNHKQEFLGKLSIPLWRIRNGEKKWYLLKDRKLLRPAKGNNAQILIEMSIIWNPIRAGIRVLDPPEMKLIGPDQRLNREQFLLNIDRLRKIGVTIFDFLQYIQSCVEWEYPVRSFLALVIYQVLVYTFHPFMVPLFLMLLILRHWLVCSITGSPIAEDILEEDSLILDGDEDDEAEDDKKMSLRQKLQAIQDATQTLQNALGSIASVCESTRNAFRMVVPFISWLTILGLFIATIVLYFIPLRYLVMAHGLNKFLRPIFRPNVQPTNEVFNILTRVPDNEQLMSYKQLKQSVSSSSSSTAQTRNRNSSPPGKEGKAGGKEKEKKKHKFW